MVFVGDKSDTLKNLLRPAYLRSLSSEDECDEGIVSAVLKLNESRDSSLDTSKSSSELPTTPTVKSSGMTEVNEIFNCSFNQGIKPVGDPAGPRNPVTFVRDLGSYWYKPSITREDGK